LKEFRPLRGIQVLKRFSGVCRRKGCKGFVDALDVSQSHGLPKLLEEAFGFGRHGWRRGGTSHIDA
jgi:hypothetical protein